MRNHRMVRGFLFLNSVICSIAAAQSTPPRKDIPAIAKAASGSIVSIVMSDKDGKPLGQGSGFLVSTDGLIVTNYHVIAEGVSAIAKFPDGAFYLIDGVLASDKARDVAVLKAHGENFRSLKLGNSDRVQVGEEIVAIGSPLSLESTVSNGIISGVRSVEEKGGKYLQITAPISPGSSGGPLFNMVGEVVGITTMYLKGGENLNFAIPINDAKRLLVNSYGTAPVPAWPNEAESRGQKHESDASSSESTTASGSDLKTTVEFMGRMAEPEHREVLQGVLKGAMLRSTNGPPITIVADQYIFSAMVTGKTQKNGHPEFSFDFIYDGFGGHGQRDYPRYISFALGDIDPSSIKVAEVGNDPSDITGFLNKHPNCAANPQCASEYVSFLASAPKLTSVDFRTTGSKPLIERGGCSSSCSVTESSARGNVFFNSKDRAERFATALIHAVKSASLPNEPLNRDAEDSKDPKQVVTEEQQKSSWLSSERFDTAAFSARYPRRQPGDHEVNCKTQEATNKGRKATATRCVQLTENGGVTTLVLYADLPFEPTNDVGTKSAEAVFDEMHFIPLDRSTTNQSAWITRDQSFTALPPIEALESSVSGTFNGVPAKICARWGSRGRREWLLLVTLADSTKHTKADCDAFFDGVIVK